VQFLLSTDDSVSGGDRIIKRLHVLVYPKILSYHNLEVFDIPFDGLDPLLFSAFGGLTIIDKIDAVKGGGVLSRAPFSGRDVSFDHHFTIKYWN
jgi:hypothetical protein